MWVQEADPNARLFRDKAVNLLTVMTTNISKSSALWLSKVIFSILPTQCECLWQWINSFHICALICVSNKQSAAAGDGLWAAVEAVSSVGTLPARMITRRPKLPGVLARISSISAANFYTRESSIFFSLSLSLRHRHTQTPPLSLYSLLFKLTLKFPSTSWTPHPFFNPRQLYFITFTHMTGAEFWASNKNLRF